MHRVLGVYIFKNADISVFIECFGRNFTRCYFTEKTFHSSRTALTPLEKNIIGCLGDYCLFYKKLFLGIINPVFLSNGANSFAASGGLRTARTVLLVLFVT